MGDLDHAAYVMYPLAVSALSFEGTTNLGYDETHIIAHGHGMSGDIHIYTHTKSRQAGRQALTRWRNSASFISKPQSLFQADYVLLSPIGIN